MYAMATPDQRTADTWRMQFHSTAHCVSLVRRQVEKNLNHWTYAQEDIDVPGHLFEVALTSNSRSCLVEVSDASPRTPKTLTPTSEDEHGRGLYLVAALSAQVGHERRQPLGKTVWARLLRTPQEQR